MSLFNKVKIKVKAKRNVGLQNKRYSLKNKERSAVVVGNKLVSVGGQLFEANFSGNIGDTVTVTNVGTPAAALYAQSTTGAVSSSNGSSGTATIVSDGALATIQAHMAQGYAEGHATSPATRVYHSIKYNVVGGAGVDESNNILYMLNTVGANGGGTCIIAAADGASPIHIAKTISIYYSNVHVVFPPGQAITYEDKASLRIMGDYAQITRKIDGTAMKLHVASTVVSNETVLELSATDTALMDAEANPALRIVRVGDKIVVRGQNDASGKSIEKDTSFVKALAKVGSYWQITCTDELDYTFQPTYPASEWPADLTTGTTIYVIEGSLLTVNSAVNDTSITVADGTVFTVGDLIEVGDNRNEYAMNSSAITGAGNPYKNPANLEQRQVVGISGNVLTLDNALVRSTGTTYYAFAALMVPVVNSTIVGARISYVADGIRSANALQVTYALDCHIYDCYVDGSGGRKGHGLRISYSYKCTAHRNRIENPKYSGSGEGYGITIYYATKILVDHNYVSGCRHNFLLQLATESIVSSNYSINDLISGIDLHGVRSKRCVIQNNHVTRSKLQDSDGSTKSGGIRIGNTSHSGGDDENLIQGNYISGYRGYNNTDGNGIDIFAASAGNIIRNNVIEHCYNGLRFGLNSKQITPVQFIDDTIVEGNVFRNCENRAVEIIAAPTYDNVNSNGKFSQITFINNISDGNNRHFEFTGVVTTLGITDVVCVGNQIINPTNVTTTYYGVSAKYVDGFVHIYDNNVSKAQRGIYLQGNGVCHVIGNKTANTVQNDPFTDGGGNTSVNYVDAMTGAAGTSWTTNGNITNASPGLVLIESDAAADNKRWEMYVDGLTTYWRVVNDAVSAGTVFMAVNRTNNTINSVQFAGTAITMTGAVGMAGSSYTTGDAAVGTTAWLAGAYGAARFEVDKTSNGTALLHRVSADSGGATLEFLKRRSGWNVVSSGDRLGSIGFSGADGVDAAIAAQIYAEVDGTPGSNDMPGRVIIAVTPDGSASTVEALRISSNLTLTAAGEITAAGRVAGAYDTDNPSYFGRAAIGYAGFSDFAGFSHVDNNTSANYALLQSASGETYVNAKTGTTLHLRVNNNDVAAVTSTGMAVTGNLSVSGSVTRNNSGFRYFYDENGITFGASAIDILPNDTGRARGVMIYGFATNSGGGVGEIRQMVSSGLPSDTTIGTDVLRITCTSGGKVSIVHYSHTGGSPQGTFSVSIDIYWAND